MINCTASYINFWPTQSAEIFDLFRCAGHAKEFLGKTLGI
jgi:hypothetical protein